MKNINKYCACVAGDSLVKAAIISVQGTVDIWAYITPIDRYCFGPISGHQLWAARRLFFPV